MKTINWLHLSDLHYGLKGQKWLWPTIKNLFFNDIAKLSEKIGQIDLVIFTGDITQSGEREQFDNVTALLTELWKKFKEIGSEPLFVSTPGNHDLLREDAIHPTVQAFRGWYDIPKIQETFWSTADNPYKIFIDERFNNYLRWEENLAIPKLPSVTRGFLVGDNSYIFDKHGIKLGIISLNTSFLQLSDENFEQRLAVHPKQIFSLCNNDIHAWSASVDISILLTHHNQDWLHPSLKEIYKSQIYPQNTFYAHLYGHMHEPYTLDTSECGSQQRRFRQAPSLFGNKYFGSNQILRIHGYTAGQYSFEKDKIVERIFPRKLVTSHAGNYNIVPDYQFELNDDIFITNITPLFPIEIPTDRDQSHNGSTIEEIDNTGITPYLQSFQKNAYPNTNINFFNVVAPSESEHQQQKILKYIIKPLAQHKNIRLVEQEAFISNLTSQRCSILVSDWGYGKEGFLYSVLDKINPNMLSNLYRISCEDVDNEENFLEAFEIQLGVTLQEFSIANFEKQSVVLLLDDIDYKLLIPSKPLGNNTTILKIVHTILDFCCDINIIITTRQVSDNFPFKHTAIGPLEVHDVKTYLINHPRNNIDYNDPDLIELLHMRSGGLPMRIDSILDNIQVTSIDSIFDIDIESVSFTESFSEPIPKALVQAIDFISQSNDNFIKKSYKLLKILSVLSDGESLQNIKWFYQKDPFYPQCASELLNLSLLSTIEQPKIISNLPEKTKKYFLSEKNDKILKVPRQVRDYVLSRMAEAELQDITKRAIEVFFGDRWREGYIKLLRSRADASKNVRFAGFGNEHRILHSNLKLSMQQSDSVDINRAIKLGLNYCCELHAMDRFWDASIAAEELLYLLENTQFTLDCASLAKICGKSLRMIGKHEKAIHRFNQSLEIGTDSLSKKEKAEIHLGLALAYESLQLFDLSLQSAAMVKQLENKNSARFMHAESIIASINFEGSEKINALKKIEAEARAKKHSVVANNITLELLAESNSMDEKIDYCNKVILSSEEDPYNRIRATIEKSSLFISQGRVAELNNRDKLSLQMAYGYLFSQRLTSLFNRCHEITWALLKAESKFDKLLRLFRYSSFLWRIRGFLNQEQKYLPEIDTISSSNVISNNDPSVASDIHYAKSRVNAISE